MRQLRRDPRWSARVRSALRASRTVDSTATGYVTSMFGARRSRPPFTLLSRTSLIWGLASYMLIGLGVIAEIIASAHVLPLRVGISLILAGAISLAVRGVAVITIAFLTRRSVRRLVDTLLIANCTFWPFRLGGSPRDLGPGRCRQARLWLTVSRSGALGSRLRRQLADCLTTCLDRNRVASWSTSGPQVRNFVGLSAWELAYHASLNGPSQVSHHLQLPVSGRRAPG
jgi:hypothetical protein